MRIILNRGREDGIHTHDVAKFYTGEDYAFKAACIYTTKKFSEWVIFRPYNKEKIHKKGHRLIGFYGRHRVRIKNYSYFKKTSLLRKMIVKKKKRKDQNKRKEIIAELFPQKEIFPLKKGSLSLSPFTYHHPHNDLNLSFGLNYLQEGDEFRYTNKLNISALNLSQEKKRETFFESKFLILNSLFGPYEASFLYQFKERVQGKISPIRYQHRFSPLGLTYIFPMHSKNFFLTSLETGYFPSFEIFSTENKNPSLVKKDFYWRHYFFLQLKFKINKKAHLNQIFHFAPLHRMSENHLDIKDSDFLFSTEFSNHINKKMALKVKEEISYDKRRKIYQNDSPMELKSSVMLEWLW